MANVTIFQNEIFAEFILPFLLMFTLVFAVLEKTKVLGDQNKQLNAIISFVIGMIFVAAIFPKQIVNDLILFLTIGLVVMLVFLLLYGFAASQGEEFKVQGWMKWTFGILAGIGIIAVVVWSAGADFFVIDLLFYQPWSNKLWTNVVFVIVAVVAMTLVIKGSKSG